MLLPLNADEGDVVTVTSIVVNLGSPIIMLVVGPESYLSLEGIFAAPPKRWSESTNW